jgi:hypothetical protein
MSLIKRGEKPKKNKKGLTRYVCEKKKLTTYQELTQLRGAVSADTLVDWQEFQERKRTRSLGQETPEDTLKIKAENENLKKELDQAKKKVKSYKVPNLDSTTLGRMGRAEERSGEERRREERRGGGKLSSVQRACRG